MGSFFDIILVLIFIVLPVVSNIIKSSQKKNKGKGASRKQPTRQGDQGGAGEVVQTRPTQPQAAQPVQARQAESGGAASSKADFERRLAEARARVQQSMSDPSSQRTQEVPRAQASQPQPTVRQVAPAQQARPQLMPQGRPQPRSLEVLKPLGGQTAKAKSIEGQSLEKNFPNPDSRQPHQAFQTNRTNRVSKAAKANREVTSNSLLGSLPKKPGKRRSSHSSDKVLTFDNKAIMGGLIWKQILDKPKSIKRISNYN